MRQIPVGPSRPPHGGRLRFALLVGAVVLAGLAGYIGYVSYPRFGLPAGVGVGSWPWPQALGWLPSSPPVPSHFS